MPELKGWEDFNRQAERLLERATGEGVAVWNARVAEADPKDEAELRAWLEARGVTGYARSHLIRERFGWPEFLTASARELLDAQYADRPQLRPIYDAVAGALEALGPMTFEARKGYISVVARRTFARIQAATKTRVDLGLRLDDHAPGGRLRPCRIHETMPVMLSLTAVEEVDGEAIEWMRKAYEQNR